MINVQLHVNDLNERLDSAVRIIDETHPRVQPNSLLAIGPISREARGLTVVLVFASYENLLYSLTRTLLEAAIRLRVSNRRLRPGFRAIAMVASVKSVKDASDKKLFSHGLPRIVDTASQGGRSCTIDTNTFPSDGSFMKKSQISVWCELFNIPNPQIVLHRTWSVIDTVVSERNSVAHGRLTADQVGRGYSEGEIRQLIEDWRMDWTDFLNFVATCASTRDFFRTPNR
jgi:hypothetical protein